MPSEELTLDVETTWDDDRLDDLEQALKSVDNQIKRTGGGGDDKVKVDIEVNSFDALTELEVLDEAIDHINNREVNIDANVDTERDFGSVASGNNGGQALATSGGRGNLSDVEDAIDESDVMQRMSAGVADRFRDQLAEVLDDTGVGATREDIDAVSNELAPTATTTDAVTFPRGRFGEGPGSLSEGETQEIFGFLDGEEVQFTRADIGEVNTDEVLQPRSGATGLAAEGIDRSASLDLVQAQSEVDDFRDNRSAFAKLIDNVTDAGESFMDARFTMDQFHSIFASLVPMFLTFVGAVPAALTALVGLAGAAIAATAALGSIGLLGLGGMALTETGELDIQPILNRMQGIFDTFITAFTPLMREFEPLVDNALTQLENLAAPLASAMRPLTQFRSTFNGLVDTIATGLPSFTRNVLAFGQAAMPILSGITDFFVETDFIGFFADQVARASASLSALAFGLENFVPALILLSQGFLNVVGVLSLFLGGLGMLLTRFPTLTAILGTVIGGFLALLTVTSLYTLANSAMVASITSSITANLGLAASSLYAAATLQAGTLAAIAFYSALTLGVLGAVAFASSLDSLSQSLGLVNGKLAEFSELSSGDLSANVGSPGSPTGSGFGSGGGSNYDVTVVSDGNKDRAARESYSTSYEVKQREQVNSVFGE